MGTVTAAGTSSQALDEDQVHSQPMEARRMPVHPSPTGSRARTPSGAGPRGLVASLIMTALLAGCGGTTGTSKVPAVEPDVTELTIDGQQAVAVAPGEGDPQALVLYLHGMDDDHEVLGEEQKRVEVVDRLVAEGYVVAASDAHFNALGNEASQQDYIDLAATLSERYGTSRTYLIAESMGSVAGLQIAADDSIPDVRGVAFISPLVDLDVVVGTEQEAQVLQAYDGALPTGAQNPAARPASDWAGTHLRFYLASEDEVVDNSRNAEPFIEQVEDVADVSVVECEGEHVAPSCFQPDDLAQWFEELA
jgi:pimeloyl-ACP methyl ester carboxylesterase